MTEKVKSLVSIVVPVYNVEEYLAGCIESILAQSYKKIEIILINDGSEDSSPRICDEYKKKDKRIKVVHKKNEGLSEARNVGLNIFSGEYVTFIDSDDQIHPHMIEFLLNAILDNDADIAIGDCVEVEKQVAYFENMETNKAEVMTGYDACKKLYNEHPYFVIACAKLYKRSLWSDLRFPIGKYHEDEFITFQILLKAKKVIYQNIPIYYYLQRSGSITQEYKEKRLDAFLAIKHQIQYYKSNGYSELEKEAYKRYHYFALIGLQRINRNQQKKLFHSVCKEYHNAVRLIKKSGMFSKKEMVWFCAPRQYPLMEKIYWKCMASKNINE